MNNALRLLDEFLAGNGFATLDTDTKEVSSREVFCPKGLTTLDAFATAEENIMEDQEGRGSVVLGNESTGRVNSYSISVKSGKGVQTLCQQGLSVGHRKSESVQRGKSPAGDSSSQLQKDPTGSGLLDRAGVVVQHITDQTMAATVVAGLAKHERGLGLDIETAKLPGFENCMHAGLDPHLSRIRLVQIYAGGDTCYVFDVFALGLDCLAPLWPRILVAHNAVFELKHLFHAGAKPAQVECTMLQANALIGALPKLATLAEDLLGWDMSKELQTSDWGAETLTAEQLSYAALDAVAAYKIYTLQAAHLEAEGLNQVYTRMRDAQAAIARLELNGFHVDLTGHSRLMQTWSEEKAAAEAELRLLLGPTINLASDKQLSNWLRTHLPDKQLKAWPKTDRGQLRTGADTLAMFKDLPLVQPLLKFKQAAKLLSSFGTGYAKHINPVTGRLHANFRLGGTATGRFSCNSPNIQQAPRSPVFRSLFTAPEGRSLVVADYSQIELRVAALVSRDRAMLEAYENGVDLHRMTASAIAGVPLEAVTKEQRQAAKAVNFGLLYGQGAKGLMNYAKASYGVTMSLKEATTAREAFFRAYPDLKHWQQETAAWTERTKRSRTPGGRIRDFRREKTNRIYTESLNTPIQGGAAEVLMVSLALLEKQLKGLDWKLVNIVHDEIVLEVAEQDAEAARQALVAAMTEGMITIFPDAPITGLVEAKFGPDWAAAK